MSAGLPPMVYRERKQKSQQIQFGGYHHSITAQDGEIWDMKNMSGEFFPLLSPRKQRYHVTKLAKPNGLYMTDKLYWVDGTKLYENGVAIMDVADCSKQFASIGDRIIIFPDKVWYNAKTKKHGSLEAKWNGTAKIQDGTYAGIAAKANTIYASGAQWANRFKVGDAVTIGSCKAHPQNNKTIIIREISGDYLRFYENSFAIKSGGESETITIQRTVPDMDYLCARENRLFGCKDDTIYVSKLGDETNWNVFDGLASDSFTVNAGSAGQFTGCCSFKGYCCFFKENLIYKLYGDLPSNYQLMDSASLGVADGSGRSLAIAGEVLFYLSRTGIVSYSGGFPQSVSKAFGENQYCNAVAGSDGRRYRVSMRSSAGGYEMFVYDTMTGMWHKEDDLQVLAFAGDRNLYWLDVQGNVWLDGNAAEIPDGISKEPVIQSMVEFGDFIEGSPNKKGISKFQLRMELEAGAQVEVLIQFDSNGLWKTVAALGASQKRSFYLPIVPRRCDHFRLKLMGIGQWKLFSLVRKSYVGSER